MFHGVEIDGLWRSRMPFSCGFGQIVRIYLSSEYIKMFRVDLIDRDV